MSFPLDYDSACDTCTPAAVCVFIFKSFAVLSIKSRTLPVKSDSWGKRKSLFSFFVLGVCCWDFGFVVVCCFLSFLETGWHACSWGWPLTHSVANNDLLRLGYMNLPIPYWKLSFEWPFLYVKTFLTPLLRRWGSPLSFCCCFYPIPFSTRPRPHPDLWCICIILELLNLGVGMPSLFMCACP